MKKVLMFCGMLLLSLYSFSNSYLEINNPSTIATDTVDGCTDTMAVNYNPDATFDDGSCIPDTSNLIFGCTNPGADNYNPNATDDDGSCYTDSSNFVFGCTNPNATNYDPNAQFDNGSCVFQTPDSVLGCTDTMALNYNLDATIDDGSCILDSGNIIFGCTSIYADNYNPNATDDNGSCIFADSILGCTDTMAFDYNPNALIDDGSCYTDSSIFTFGCTDPSAINYNPNAQFENGTCQYQDSVIYIPGDVYGCTSPYASNYNVDATIDNGTCVYDSSVTDTISIEGCTDLSALNYNPYAIVDDSSCIREQQEVNTPIETDAPIEDTLETITNDACAVDFSRIIDQVEISSSNYLSNTELEIIWTIFQGNSSTDISTIFDISGTDLSGDNFLCYAYISCSSPSTTSKIATSSGIRIRSVLKTSIVTGTDVEVLDFNYVYPNPFNDVLNIKLDQEVENGVIEISDISGSLVKEINASGKYSTVNMSDLNAGTYILTVRSDNQMITQQKITKN